MTIGEKIKELRKKNGLTQEKLADYLRVSYQAVSKWETGIANPDLSLIAPLTKLLRVSADELLGLNQNEPDARYNELEEKYDATFKTDDLAERLRICEIAVSEYPGDMEFLSNLAWVVSNRSFEHEDNESYIAEQEKAIELFDAVIKNCGDGLLRANAIVGIVQLLRWRGRKDEAKRYAEMLPERTVNTRDSVWENCLEGDELIEFKRKRLLTNFGGLLWELGLMPYESDYCKDLMETLVKDMLLDGNNLEFNHYLYYAKKSRIDSEIKKADAAYDFVMKLLGELRSYACAYDEISYVNQGIHRYTAVVFDHIEEDTRDWLSSEGSTLMDDFKEFLTYNKFDILRDREGFKELFD